MKKNELLLFVCLLGFGAQAKVTKGGVGAWFGHFNIDLNYLHGFVSVFEGENNTISCDKLQVRSGYAFLENNINNQLSKV